MNKIQYQACSTAYRLAFNSGNFDYSYGYEDACEQAVSYIASWCRVSAEQAEQMLSNYRGANRGYDILTKPINFSEALTVLRLKKSGKHETVKALLPFIKCKRVKNLFNKEAKK